MQGGHSPSPTISVYGKNKISRVAKLTILAISGEVVSAGVIKEGGTVQRDNE